LRAKPGGDAIPVTMGDFADVAVTGEFALVFVAFTTFFALRARGDQARCFANVARHLEEGGRFVIEAFVPDPSRFVRAQHVEISCPGAGGVLVNVSRHDGAAQRVASLVMWASGEGLRAWPVHVCYSYPAELDAMARAEGLTLEHRWSNWRKEPFGAESGRHVSVYRRA
jgi:hypothetical protein